MAQQRLPKRTFALTGRVIYKLKRVVKNNLEDNIKLYFQKPIWSKVINQKEIRIAGLRRTGNHAVISWIRAQEPGTVWHINNLCVAENPYRYKYYYFKDHYSKYQEIMERYRKETKEKLTPKDCLIYNYEDYSLKQIFTKEFEKKHDLYLGKSSERYDLLILRDPFNLLASRLKKNYLSVKAPHKTFVDLWIEYAKEYLGETQYLKHNKVCINYNQWTADISYRQQIAAQLNMNFTDAGITSVSAYGGGSSFEGRELDGQAINMDIHNRWTHFIEDQTYRKLLDNKELLKYSEQIFGHIPGTEVFKDKR